MKNIAIIGYSGHSYVVIDIFHSQNRIVSAYCEREEKINPYQLDFLGNENEITVIEKLKNYDYFVAIGENSIRKKITEFLLQFVGKPINAIHSSAIISSKSEIGDGVMIGANSVINSLAKIGKGTICNTSCVVEHECEIGNFCHIAPSAVLCGNVKVGDYSFIGANTVVKQGVSIGKNSFIGAGSTIYKDIPDHSKVVGSMRFI